MLQSVACGVVVAVGVAALSLATDGFRAITTEGARRLSIEASPRPVPEVAFTDHRGRGFRWADVGPGPVLVEFIFTTCPDVCQKMNSDFAALEEDARGAFRLLSISFDPERDTVERLAQVASGYGADGETWRFARVDDSSELESLLDGFGVVAIPSPLRGFEHNAAIHGVDRTGHLARVVDIWDTAEIERWARAEGD